MLLDAGLPIKFWAEAIKTACYLHRRTPSSSLPGNLTPYETLYGSPPKIHHLRRFGCTVYKHIPRELRDSKFSSRSKPCMMLGYVHRTSKIWRLWDFSGRGRAVESSNAIFKEEENAYGRAHDIPSSEHENLEFPVDYEIHEDNDSEVDNHSDEKYPILEQGTFGTMKRGHACGNPPLIESDATPWCENPEPSTEFWDICVQRRMG